MKVSIRIFIFCCLIFGFQKSDAQVFYDCVDTSRINAYYNCGNPEYLPVCGCNGVTYRNECSAYFVGGVNYNTSGTCENFGFDILENPVATNLTLSVYTKQSERVTMQAWNDMGNLYYEVTFNGIEFSVHQFFVDTSDWPRGVYIIVVIVMANNRLRKW